MSGYRDRAQSFVDSTPPRPNPGSGVGDLGTASSGKPTPVGRRTPKPALDHEGVAVTRCPSQMRCVSCNQRMAEGGFVCRVGSSLVHNSKPCIARQKAVVDAAVRDAAMAAEQAAKAPEETLPPCPPCDPGSEDPAPMKGPVARTGSDQRRAQLAAGISEGRRARVRSCLAGTCGVVDEEQMKCLTCNRCLHGVSCASITKGYASVGCFRCPACRIAKEVPDLVGEPPPKLVERAEVTFLLSLTSGAEATGGGVCRCGPPTQCVPGEIR